MHKPKPNALEVVFLGTFPPTNEGIATFTEDLVNACQKVAGDNLNCRIAAMNLSDTSPFYFDHRVGWEIDQDSLETYINVAHDINNSLKVICVIIQHEYGIYGGPWGRYILKFIKLLKKPVITVLHTVTDNIENKKEIFEEVTKELINLSDKIVVLSKTSENFLVNKYPQFANKFTVIPHGIHPVDFTNPKTIKKNLRLSKNTVLTTFGFLSRGKGIEYVIKALPGILEKHPNVIYQILGQTHPVILKREGEKYRTELVKLVKDLGIRKHVRFVDKYLDLRELLYFLEGTDIYIATSLNEDQTVSGTFSYALGTGRAVVATNFVQSKEMVTPGIGKLVPAGNSKAYTAAVNELLDEKNTLLKYHRLAYKKTRSMLWSNVGLKYVGLIEKTADLQNHNKFTLPEIDLSYLIKMTGEYGIYQFAKYDTPLLDFGYTVDDNSRALTATGLLLEKNHPNFKLKSLFKKYFEFVKNSLQSDGSFINYFDEEFKPTDQNKEENPQDHYGRILLSLSYILTGDSISAKYKNMARNLWFKAFNKAYVLGYTRPNALVLKSLCILYEKEKTDDTKNIIINLAEILVSHYHANSTSKWNWFEDKITYNNAILPEALILAFKITKNQNYLKIAKKSFSFLLKSTFMGDVFAPIGQRYWFKKDGRRSYYDQQPEEVSAMVQGLITMYETTKEKKYKDLARKAFSWFLGNNLKGIPLYNRKNGGVYDGLTENGVNKNQGAESLVSYLIARVMIEKYY